MATLPLPILIGAIIVGLAVILGLLWFILNMNKTQEPKDRLITLVSTGFIILLGVFLVDKVIAVKVDILSQQDSATLFQYIKDISTLVFGYYFGTQVAKKD